MKKNTKLKVSIVMGSQSDYKIMKLAEKFNRLLQVREEKYVPYPQKWLKNEGWNEEITIGERRADFHHDAPTLQNTEQETNIRLNIINRKIGFTASCDIKYDKLKRRLQLRFRSRELRAKNRIGY